MVRPILSAMRRNKFGSVLIVVQIAVTLAILSNAVTLIGQRLKWSTMPTGISESSTFAISAQTVDHPKDIAALQAADLAALKSLVGDGHVYATNSYPLEGSGWLMEVYLAPHQDTPSAMTAYYFGDENTLSTLGMKLVAGRNFLASEISDRDSHTVPPASGWIITKTLASRLFPNEKALGQFIFVENLTTPVPIIGIIDRLEGPFADATGYLSTVAENSIVAPYRPVGESVTYLARAPAEQLDATMRAGETKLTEINNNRVFRSKSMTQAHADASRDNRALVLLLAIVCIMLMVVTALGIFGLTSYWVSQRHRQIGIRRAVGATRAAIVQYFLVENLLIVSAGVLVGGWLSFALNNWIISSFEIVRVGLLDVAFGAAAMLILGQVATMLPALRASIVPPAVAARRGI